MIIVVGDQLVNNVWLIPVAQMGPVVIPMLEREAICQNRFAVQVVKLNMQQHRFDIIALRCPLEPIAG